MGWNKEYTRAWREKHREEIRAYSKRYAQEHKEEFRVYAKRRYAKHKEKINARSKMQRERRRAELDARKQQPCLDCGKSYPPYVMEFDHVRGEKLFNVGRCVVEPKKLAAEIAKCDLVCANCHRERTYGVKPSPKNLSEEV